MAHKTGYKWLNEAEYNRIKRAVDETKPLQGQAPEIADFVHRAHSLVCKVLKSSTYEEYRQTRREELAKSKAKTHIIAKDGKVQVITPSLVPAKAAEILLHLHACKKEFDIVFQLLGGDQI